MNKSGGLKYRQMRHTIFLVINKRRIRTRKREAKKEIKIQMKIKKPGRKRIN